MAKSLHLKTEKICGLIQRAEENYKAKAHECRLFVRLPTEGRSKPLAYSITQLEHSFGDDSQGLAHDILLAAFPLLLKNNRKILFNWELISYNDNVTAQPSTPPKRKPIFTVDIQVPARYAGLVIVFYSHPRLKDYFPHLVVRDMA